MRNQNKYSVCKPMTFLDLTEEWLGNKAYHIKPSTAIKYQTIIDKYIVKYFQNIYLSTISTVFMEKKMRQIYEDNSAFLSFSTFKSIFYVIKSVIAYGICSEYIPQIYITFSITNYNESEEIQTLSEEQECQLIQILMKNISNPNHLGIFLSLYTGMRLGEVCALSAHDIDFDKRTITISKTVQRLKAPNTNATTLSITTPKSKRSHRIIPITDFLMEILYQCNIDQLPKEMFILSRKTCPYEPRTLQYAFRRIMNKCGYDGYHFHCLRHTFATKCVHLGFEIKTLSELLGHSNVAFTMNRYVHTDINEKRKQMHKLEKNWQTLMN